MATARIPEEFFGALAHHLPPEQLIGPQGGRAGYDGAERRKGSKVHMAVDTLGHLLSLHVTPADVQDRARVAELAEAVQRETGRSIELAYVDQGYTGESAAEAAESAGIRLEVVKLPEAKRGFVLLPRRWVVERSFGWAARFRRLARDYERRAPTPGVSPGLTDVALRTALGEPCKELYVYSGDELVLAAPRSSQSVDANNGPKPRKNYIVEVMCKHMFLVRFQVEACIRECPPDSPITQYILSSRYETSHDVDPQHRTVITTSGVTLFRTDLLAAAGLQPDHFRSQVMLPIPLGFHRKAIKVTAKPAATP